MNALTDWLVTMTVASGVTLLLVLVARRLLSGRLDARASYALWLAVPVQFALLIPGLAPGLPSAVQTLLPTLRVTTLAPGTGSGAIFTLPALLWLVGLGLMLVRLGAHLLRAREIVVHSRPLNAPANWPALPPRALRECDRIQAPLVAGLFRPCIIVPPGFSDRQPQATTALILGHELCHLRRRDNLVNLAAELLLSLQWFNPLAWIAMRAFRTDQEVRADAAAVVSSETAAPARYARALLDMAGRQTSPALTSAWYSVPSLKRRIAMLNRHQPPRAGTLAAGLLLALTVPMAGTALGAGGERPAGQAESAASSDVIPLVRINPRYPADAAEQRIEGFVTAEFTVTEDGRVADIVVLDSAPGDTFVPEATIALSRWRFQPMVVDGTAVPRRATQTIEFEID